MSALPESFRALVAEKQDDDVARGLQDLRADDLPDGDVVVRVDWSSVNYKDALAVSPKGQVAQISPLVPGVDLAGTVVVGRRRGLRGDRARPRPRRRPPRRLRGVRAGAGRLGRPAARRAEHAPGDGARDRRASPPRCPCSGSRSTASTPDDGPVLVLGASGGVGSTAVGILAARGFEVVAATGKPDEADWLRELGASDVLSRDETSAESKRPMEKERWAAVVDPVGGTSLAYALRTTRYGGAVAASGLTGGTSLETTVFPFILRGVSLLGRRLRQHPDDVRLAVWERLAGDLRPNGLDESITREIALDDVDALPRRRAGRQGRRAHRS